MDNYEAHVIERATGRIERLRAAVSAIDACYKEDDLDAAEHIAIRAVLVSHLTWAQAQLSRAAAS